MSFLGYSMLKHIATLKSRSMVNQGNWKWYHSIDCAWFPYSKFVPKTHRFSDIRLVVYSDFETRVRITQGHQNWYVSIRHLWLPVNVPWQLRASPTVSEINGDFSPKSQTVFCTPDEGVLLELGISAWGSKTRILGLPSREKCLRISSAVWIQYSTRTWRTSGRTDTGRHQKPR